MYKITISKLTENPKYKEPGPRPGYYREEDQTESIKYLTEKSLETELTDEEFQAVKKACLEVM